MRRRPSSPGSSASCPCTNCGTSATTGRPWLGAAARLAAQRALAGEVATLREHVGRLRARAGLTERRRADARIHIEIAAVAQSPRLTREEMNLWSEVGDLVWLPVTAAR